MSVLAHAGLLGLIATWLTRDEAAPTAAHEPPRDHAPLVTIEVVARPVAAEPMEVVVIERAPAPAARAPAVARAAPGPAALRGAAGEQAVTTTANTRETGTHEAKEPGTGALAMRGRRHDLKVSPELAGRVLRPVDAVEPVKPTGQLAPHGAEARIDDAVAKFRVYADGTIDIEDKPDIEIGLQVPIPTPSRILRASRAFGNDVSAWLEDPYRDTRAGPMQDLPNHLLAIPGACQQFGDRTCEANPQGKLMRSMSGQGLILPLLGGKLDITSYLHRKHVGDPYASRKLKVLDSTRAERVARGTAYRAEQQDRSAELMQRNLDALWRSPMDAAARRQALFELWDECAEGEGEAGEAGERARAMVIGSIRARLPEGADGAYAAADLARLDEQRTSNQHFAPY